MANTAIKHLPEDGEPNGAKPSAPPSIFEYAPGDSPAAALQNLIYRRFAEMDSIAVQPEPNSFAESRLEATIGFVSRWGGVGLFFTAITGIVLMIM